MTGQRKSRQNTTPPTCAARRLQSYPYPYPSGWYRLADSNALGRGEVRRFACLGRQFALHRSEDADDVFAMTANRARAPEHAPAETFPVQEVHGQIFLYLRGGHAPQRASDAAPYDAPRIPDVDSGRFVYRGQRDGGRVRMHLIEFAENSVDFAHFQIIHGRFRIPGTNLRLPGIGIEHTAGWEPDADRPWVAYFTDQVVLKLFGRRINGSHASALITFTGPGSVVTFRFAVPGLGEIEMVQTHLPLAPLEQQVNFRWFADRDFPRPLVSYVVGNWIAQWRQDVAIWENKIYRPHPALSGADGPIFRMRQWYRQFLPDGCAGGPSASASPGAVPGQGGRTGKRSVSST